MAERAIIKKATVTISDKIVKLREEEWHVIKPYEIAVDEGRILLFASISRDRPRFPLKIPWTSRLIYGVIGVSNDPTTVYDSNDASLLFLSSRKFPSCCISLARMRRDGYTRLRTSIAEAREVS